MNFSERAGIKPIKDVLQVGGMDDALRNSLWNVVQIHFWDKHKQVGYVSETSLHDALKIYWSNFFKRPTDEIPLHVREATKWVRNYFFAARWNEVYDFVEFTAIVLMNRQKYFDSCNFVLQREVSGYRFIGGQITPITQPNEVAAIEDAIQGVHTTRGAQVHLTTALSLLADRTNPDYRNSIKESISAVESVVQSVSGVPNSTLGDGLKLLSQHAPLHPALNKSLTSLYGYTSDSNGIRHALLEEPNLDFADAKFMLVACSAFVSYLVHKSAKA